jgi:hypothetical protein
MVNKGGQDMNATRNLLAALVVGVVALALPATAAARPVGGVVQKLDSVGARSTQFHSVTLAAGRPVTVLVIGDGDTDLDLYVVDPLGNEVGSDLGPTDNCVLTVNPKFNGTYTIKVKNLGSVFNRYALIVK